MDKRNQECKNSLEAGQRLIAKYGSFVEVEKIVNEYEELKGSLKELEEDTGFPEKKYTYQQFSLFDRY